MTLVWHKRSQTMKLQLKTFPFETTKLYRWRKYSWEKKQKQVPNKWTMKWNEQLWKCTHMPLIQVQTLSFNLAVIHNITSTNTWAKRSNFEKNSAFFKVIFWGGKCNITDINFSSQMKLWGQKGQGSSVSFPVLHWDKSWASVFKSKMCFKSKLRPVLWKWPNKKFPITTFRGKKPTTPEPATFSFFSSIIFEADRWEAHRCWGAPLCFVFLLLTHPLDERRAPLVPWARWIVGVSASPFVLAQGSAVAAAHEIKI